MALRFITNHMDGVSVKLPCDVCSPTMSTLEPHQTSKGLADVAVRIWSSE
jgi:hypothetical protein